MRNNINNDLFNRHKRTLLERLNVYPSDKKYILLDPCAVGEPDDIFSNVAEKCPIPIYYQDMALTRRPYLLEIKDDEAGDSLLDASIRLAISETMRDRSDPSRFRCMCAWLTSSDDINLLSEKLALKSIIKQGDGNETLFRFYDPRIMDLLLEILQPAQFSNGLYRLSGWFWLSRESKLCSYPISVVKTNAPVWYLTKEQKKSLSRSTWINICLDKQFIYPNVYINKLTVSELDGLLSYIDNNYGIDEKDDAITYAHYIMTKSRNIDNHPEIKRLLNEWDKENELLSVLLGNVEQRVWDEMTDY
ncbi:hypothetical protein SOASR030_28660 [Leminorella grimontii]|uniref:DUF4123 domain-containing protein n=1 Tax=Leminorella grimontii TaxID=82981 RepID=A0AAV5N4T0_9GAMM|nr:DUF4123 domain-containing protein [Leminorella grimontii]KFC92870.1 hypothetical protein GLGR_3566 [Leminorella grimontii ATCC 33999 = DSM 5078]GKX56754.1 hypothetical protein SOASR030_28660 [Leminorella grimontii]VFS62229.1 Uncharacterised protein [Leminorella grimontii]